ncbi:hypothetical protein ACJX0J_006339, partial [Zea mays]
STTSATSGSTSCSSSPTRSSAQAAPSPPTTPPTCCTTPSRGTSGGSSSRTTRPGAPTSARGRTSMCPAADAVSLRGRLISRLGDHQPVHVGVQDNTATLDDVLASAQVDSCNTDGASIIGVFSDTIFTSGVVHVLLGNGPGEVP